MIFYQIHLWEVSWEMTHLHWCILLVIQSADSERGAAANGSRSTLNDEQSQLQSKLSDLHQKKSQMDRLLNELQTIKGHVGRSPSQNNGKQLCYYRNKKQVIYIYYCKFLFFSEPKYKKHFNSKLRIKDGKKC